MDVPAGSTFLFDIFCNKGSKHNRAQTAFGNMTGLSGYGVYMEIGGWLATGCCLDHNLSACTLYNAYLWKVDTEAELLGLALHLSLKGTQMFGRELMWSWWQIISAADILKEQWPKSLGLGTVAEQTMVG